MIQLVKAFVTDSYQLISASSPTVPLHGSDVDKGVQFLNELLNYYSSTGLLLPIPVRPSVFIPAGQQFITAGLGSSFDIQDGRFAEVQGVFLTRDNVDYPLAEFNRYEFDSSYKFSPLQALPLYWIIRQQIDSTQIQLYPKPDTGYDVTINAKQQFPELLETSDMSIVPMYYVRFLKYALARELAFYKGRSEAWTPMLDRMYVESKLKIEGAGEFNLNIESISNVQLNGARRVQAGI